MNHTNYKVPLAVALFATLPMHVQAQVLEEVVVTAQKREQNVMDVPISIAAMGAESIEQTAIRELREIADYIPNVEISGGDGGTITVRGVGSSSRHIGFDSRVGVYIDGVYMGQSPAANQDILDLERIEVLRGPQGTLFGKNAVAGAINLITKKPADEFAASVLVGAGNYDSRRVRGMVDIPLSDTVSTRFSVNTQSRDGFIDNIYTGDEISDQDGISGRAQLKAALSDNLEMNIALDYLNTDIKAYNGQHMATGAGLSIPNAVPFEALNDVVPKAERTIQGAALTFDWGLSNDFLVKSITAYRETEYDTSGDLDGGYDYANDLGIAFLFGITSETDTEFWDKYEQFTQEFQLISPADRRLQYVLGLYYYDQQGSTDRAAISHNDPDHPFYAGGVLPYPGDTFDTIRTTGTVDTTSYAAFVNGTYEITGSLTLGLGARYSVEEKEVDWISDVSDNSPDLLGVGIPGLGNGIFGFPQAHLEDDREDDYFAPEASLRYAFNDELNIYYRYSTGYKSGGYNVDFITQAAYDLGLEFDKETVASHEIGLKGDLFDRRLTFAMSVFQADYDDYQVQSFVPNPGGAAITAILRNAAEVRSRGFELEIEALLTDNLKLIASLGILDVNFEDFPGGGEDEDGNQVNLAGNTVGGSSADSFNLGLQYHLPIPSMSSEAVVRLDYLYRGEHYADTQNENEKERELADGAVLDNYYYLEDSHRLNGRIALNDSDGKWTVAIWGRNLTDENDYQHALTVFQSYARAETLPRTYGVELSYNF